MKICSLYGAGYYYMPGTDICLKLGGYVRWQISANPGASITGGPHFGTGGFHTRRDSVDTAQRTRALITIDTRQQTAYGTLRTYTLLGYSQDSTIAETTSPPVYMTRGFIQIAGFTFGKATSFFDIVPGASFAYNAGMFYHPDTGDAGKMLAAYTAQFGNGVSGTIALQQSPGRGVFRGGSAPAYALFANGNPLDSAEGNLAVKGVTGWPDLVGNIRIDQSWGTWQVAAAARHVGGQYYGTTDITGGPDSKLGWAATTGVVLNLPMITPGDRFALAGVYAEGATAYAAVTPSGGPQNKFEGNSVGFGFWEDAVYHTPGAIPGAGGLIASGGIQLTTVWSASAAFEHLWTPALKTSWYGSYVDVSHNAEAKAIICNSGGVGSMFTAGNPAVTGCDPDWQAWNIGSRTQWEPLKGLIMGVDVIYNRLLTAKANNLGTVTLAGTAIGAKALGSYRVEDMDSWMATFRVQRDFLP